MSRTGRRGAGASPEAAVGAAPAATARRSLLVHGATADHTTWRAVGPRFAATRRVFAIDRRGRGASGDAAAYAIEREFEDVAAVAEARSRPMASVDVAGHSYGGRCALGASLLTPAIRRLVVYEGAPVPPGMTYRPQGLVEAVRAALARGDNEAALSTFLAGIVGMSDAGLDAYRRDPVWPARVAAAHTILREIEAEATPPASIEALAGVRAPVLLILGSISRSPFRIGTEALAAPARGRASGRHRWRRPCGAPHPRAGVRGAGRALPRRSTARPAGHRSYDPGVSEQGETERPEPAAAGRRARGAPRRQPRTRPAAPSCGAALAQRESIGDLRIPGLTSVDPALEDFDKRPLHLRGPSPSQGMAPA